MSLYDYRYSQKLSRDDPPFYALIMAAIRKADSDNVKRLEVAFPETWLEFKTRYHAAGGLLPGEQE